MKKVTIPGALPMAGHYSPAIVANGFVYVSGILPVNPFTGEKLTSASFAGQTTQVLENLEALLEAAGSSLEKLVKVTVYVNHIEEWETFNKLYKEKLGEHKPARAVVPVGDLHFGLALELEAVALA